MASRSFRVTMACLAGPLVASSACLLFTSVDGLSGQTPTADGSDTNDRKSDASEEGAFDGGARADGPLPDADAVGLGAGRVIVRASPGVRGLGVDLTRVFFSNEDTGELRSAPKTGEADAGSMVLGVFANARDLAVDATRVYWIDGSGYAFTTSKKDGTDVVYGPYYHSSVRMTVAAGHVFTSTRSANSIWYVMRDGAALDVVGYGPASQCIVSDGATAFYELGGVLYTHPAPDGAGPFATADAIDLAVDATTLYWLTSTGLVQKLDKDKRGQPPVTLASGVAGLARISVDDESVYATAWGLGMATGRVVRIPKVGGPTVDVATGLSEPWGIAVDGSGVYVANHGDGTIVAVPRL